MTSPNTIIADMQAEIDALRKDNGILLSAIELIAMEAEDARKRLNHPFRVRTEEIALDALDSIKRV